MGEKEHVYKMTDGTEFPGYLKHPSGGEASPALLIITSIFGIDEEMKQLANGFAEDGFLVSVPEIFSRTVPGPIPVARFQEAMQRMVTYDFDQGALDTEEMIKQLRTHPNCNGKLGILGFCFGGRHALVAAARFGVNAAASYHGTAMGQHADEIQDIQCPVSFHFGNEDPAVPLEEVEKIRAAFAGHDNAEITIHDGAAHNFSMPEKPGYHPEVAAKSRASVLQCFRFM